MIYKITFKRLKLVFWSFAAENTQDLTVSNQMYILFCKLVVMVLHTSFDKCHKTPKSLVQGVITIKPSTCFSNR